jgi:hypothetical protein
VVVDLRKFGSELLLVVERTWADRMVECGPGELPVALLENQRKMRGQGVPDCGATSQTASRSAREMTWPVVCGVPIYRRRAARPGGHSKGSAGKHYINRYVTCNSSTSCT